MADEIRLTIVPRSSETHILMTEGPDDVLMARLAPVTAAHPRWAAPMLLQALASWQGRPVRVVLSADAEGYLYSLGLSDGLGLGDHALHYVVDVVDPGATRRGRRLRGLGDFRDARRQLQLAWPRGARSTPPAASPRCCVWASSRGSRCARSPSASTCRER